MNGAHKTMRNPLLSAAGPGFPYENYTENALLVPVVPATPAVLRDDAELDNFVEQEPVDIQSQGSSRTHENTVTNEFSQPQENKDTADQSTKQGYFTSILSSLPSLTLSSGKTDSTESQIGQPSENIGGATRESDPHVSPTQGHHAVQPKVPGLSAINSQNPRSADPPGFAAAGPALQSPPQSTIPLGLPQTGDAPVSYRLGNQRRLKYAPPLALTSNNARPYPNPAIQPFFPSQNASTPPTILNPYEPEGSARGDNCSAQQAGASSDQLSPSEQLSRNNSLYNSFRSSPVAVGSTSATSCTTQNSSCESPVVPALSQSTPSLSRPIPARVLEPATPQNTPANSSFPGFVAYASRDLPLTSSPYKEITAFESSDRSSSLSDFSKDSTFEVVEIPRGPASEETVTFAPISAAKVTEKLEHLLAEREGDLSCKTSPEITSTVDDITSGVAIQLTKSSEPAIETVQAANDKTYEIKVNDVEEKTALGDNSLSEVFLGQRVAARLPPNPEKHTDNNLFVVNDQAAKSSSCSLEKSYQEQSTFVPSSAYYASRPADSKSSLNYAPTVQFSQQGSFHDPPKPVEQSASVFFESKSSEQFSNFSFQPSNGTSGIFGQSTTDLSDSQQVRENSAFVPTTLDPTIRTQFWSTNQPSQSQTLNPAASQPRPDQLSALYNSIEFANEPLKQPTFPYTYDQSAAQQQSYQSPSLYGSINGFQHPFTTNEINAAHPLSVPLVTAAPEPTGSATLSPTQMSVNLLTNRTTPDTIPPSFQNWAAGPPDKRMQYRAVYHHWFYRKEVESKVLWIPFSMQDSLKLEEVHNSSDITPETVVATDGGRYDVDILRRQREPVYWTGTINEVRRCSWFFKNANESKYIPYDESTAVKLEEEYKQACLTSNWNRRVELNNGEYIVFHSATVQTHYLQTTSLESSGSWGNSSGSEDATYLQGATSKPRVVKRGVDEFNIDEGEPETVDHLLFLVHGIGSVCDLKFRTVEEVVDEFRSISLQLVQSHYRTASEQGIVNRIEVLPISWHTTLHSEDTGIDKKLQAITLKSIPRLRHFTNDTLLDILFYTSPIYCQTIMHTVGSEMNRLHALFKDRNPNFDGGIYLGGHSLGSLIMFDLLCHQKPPVEETVEENEDSDGDKRGENDSVGPIAPMPAAILKRRLSKKVSYVMGAAGTGQPYIHYPQLNFHPRAFFALGSPIGMFVTVRGIDTLGEDFALPTCPAFFNIFHPFDPVAYRVESLINPEACKFHPMLIPHHKGRKRMHLELKETMARVGADLKQKLLDSVKSTWNSVYQLALFHKPDNQALEREIDKVVEEQLQKPPSVSDQNSDDGGADLKVGKLNKGRRIDYVLQEAPFEYINEYIFAITSHICYWESEDTMLLILKEIYGSMGIQTDAQLPQQTLSIERVSPSPSSNLSAVFSPSNSNVGTPSSPVMGIDPTVPMTNKPVGPPPKSGFVRKS